MLCLGGVVVGMGTDPEPHKPVLRFDGQGAIVGPHSGRPEATDLLEVERWVPRILFQTRIGLIGKLLDIQRQRPVGRPEIGRCVVSQRGLVLPAAWSRSAFSARSSSLPA